MSVTALRSLGGSDDQIYGVATTFFFKLRSLRGEMTNIACASRQTAARYALRSLRGETGAFQDHERGVSGG
jgi:hypothetical protein